ncbi:hypothetical protein V6N13_076179 [Hibiscus sabdariffa]
MRSMYVLMNEKVMSMDEGHESSQGREPTQLMVGVGQGIQISAQPSFKDKPMADSGKMQTSQYISELDVEIGAEDVHLGGSKEDPGNEVGNVGVNGGRDGLIGQDGMQEVAPKVAVAAPTHINSGVSGQRYSTEGGVRARGASTSPR